MQNLAIFELPEDNQEVGVGSGWSVAEGRKDSCHNLVQTMKWTPEWKAAHLSNVSMYWG